MLNVHEPVLVSLCACNSVFASSNFTVIKSPKGIFFKLPNLLLSGHMNYKFIHTSGNLNPNLIDGTLNLIQNL